jgi:hypothetical protein
MIMHDQIFWVVVGIFYLLPHIKFIERTEGFIFVSLKGRSGATLVSSPFETIRGVFCLINPLAPYRAVFRCKWGILDHSRNNEVRRSWASICRINKELHGLRIVAAASWIVLFVAGPAMTWQIGLGQTLVLLAPIWVGLYLLASYLLLTAKLGRGKGNVCLLLFECLLCPGYLPALPKILTSKLAVSADMSRIVKRYGEFNTWLDLKAMLERRIEIEIYDDPSREEELMQYRAAIQK